MIISDNVKDTVTKKRILLVDDEETLRLSVKQVLSEDGYEVITAKNGTEALGLARANDFDLVITDLRMPGLSGLQLVSEIKKTDPLTKIIIISAYGNMETVVEAMRLGANDFVAKPFKVKSMKEIVTKILNVSRKKPRTALIHSSSLEGVTANADETEKESDSIFIQPNLSYYLDHPQEALLGIIPFFDAVCVAEKKFAMIFGSMPSNYGKAGVFCNTSLLDTMVKTVFRTAVTPLPNPPRERGGEDETNLYHVVDKINKYLCFNIKPRIPISLFCAMIDKDKGVIKYVNHGQKLFCYLLQGEKQVHRSALGGCFLPKIATLESSPYPLNLFPDIHIEEKTLSLTGESKLILSSSDSLTALPIGGGTVKADLRGIFLEACSHQGVEGSQPKAGRTLWRGKEIVRKIRTSLSSAISTNNLDSDWVVMVVDLDWNGIEPKQEKIIIPASTKDFRGIISQIEDILKGFTLTPQKEHGIITAINEAIINARLFACHRGGDGKTGDIIVMFTVMGNELIVEVFDSGCGFSVQSYKKPDFTDYKSVTGESGRGIFLIQKLMDRVMVQSSENIGTRVYMAKEVISNGS